MRSPSPPESPPPPRRSDAHMSQQERLDAQSFAKRVMEGSPRTSDDRQGPTPEDPGRLDLLLTNPAISARDKLGPIKIYPVKRDKKKPDKRAGRQKMGLLGHVLRWLNLR